MVGFAQRLTASRSRRLLAGFSAVVMLILFLAIAAAAVLTNLPQGTTAEQFLTTAGKIAGLWAAILIMVQFAFSARSKILNKIFGIDRLMVCHKFLGPTAFTLAVLHPLLLYNSGSYVFGSLRLELWPELLGVLILILLTIVVCTSLFRAFLRLDYQYWRIIHQFVFAAFLLMAVHSLTLGSDLQFTAMRVLWLLAILLYAAVFIWVKFIKQHSLKKNPYLVTEVTPLNHNTVNLKLQPANKNPLEYLPGQFAFLRLFRKGFKTEEHPFTISSSPANRDYISFSIKNSGDYTSTIDKTKPADKATVEAPLGRFSFILYPPAEHLVLIAGGIGITPLLSMLRYIAQEDSQKKVTLIWANRTTRDTFLPDEFAEISRMMPNLKIHHIMSQQPDYPGLKGFLNEMILKDILSPVSGKEQVFLCGPPIMMKLVTHSLQNIGLHKKQIHTENFAI
jgi:predicted ferric reductase